MFFFKLSIFAEDQDQFVCPTDNVKKVDAQGQTVVHPKYAHEEDCQRFYVCLNGHEKRSLGCEAGKVYNIEREQCDDPENVPGWWVDNCIFEPSENISYKLFCCFCSENWYKDDDSEKKSRRKKWKLSIKLSAI